MDNYKFDLNSIWRIRNAAGDSLSFGAYEGYISLTLFKKGSSKPDIKVSAPTSYLIRWESILKELTTANPGTRIPFVELKYDRTTNQSTKGITIIFAKDEKNCYSLELQTTRIPPIKFNLRGTGMYSDGTKSMSEEERSLMGLRELIRVMHDELPFARLLSKYGNGSQSNFNKQSSSGGEFKKQSPSADPFTEASDVF